MENQAERRSRKYQGKACRRLNHLETKAGGGRAYWRGGREPLGVRGSRAPPTHSSSSLLSDLPSERFGSQVRESYSQSTLWLLMEICAQVPPCNLIFWTKYKVCRASKRRFREASLKTMKQGLGEGRQSKGKRSRERREEFYKMTEQTTE